jgi:hypothetical protein
MKLTERLLEKKKVVPIECKSADSENPSNPKNQMKGSIPGATMSRLGELPDLFVSDLN